MVTPLENEERIAELEAEVSRMKSFAFEEHHRLKEKWDAKNALLREALIQLRPFDTDFTDSIRKHLEGK